MSESVEWVGAKNLMMHGDLRHADDIDSRLPIDKFICIRAASTILDNRKLCRRD
jgi:hypothetical protein